MGYGMPRKERVIAPVKALENPEDWEYLAVFELIKSEAVLFA